MKKSIFFEIYKKISLYPRNQPFGIYKKTYSSGIDKK